MLDFEKSGMFYLGKRVDPKTGKTENKPLLYNSKDLTTHAVCVGMTGSGKTGLGIALLEEAAIDKVPSIVIDPKGDLSNLALTFPNLSSEEFAPWIDESDAEQKNMDKKMYSEYIAKTWKKGLASWGQTEERIKAFRNSVDIAIYTPASKAGIPLSILHSFSAPSKEQNLEPAAFTEKAMSLTSSLLELLGIDSNPIKSKEHILISTLIQKAWQEGENLDIATLVKLIQKPSLTKIGALDLETFYPAKERIALSITLNNLLASSRFQAWTEGNSLNIDNLLYTKKGKPKVSIISIAHLQDSDRMFFVTLLLNEILVWMRQQPGTSNLKAILYMDEIFGFFPPTAAPPSKQPMLTLLKQARAYGLGIVLATQNPADLDYKGLSNCGTWFIGKLQTERDKLRLIEGLKTTQQSNSDSEDIDKSLQMTGNRTFILRSIHSKNLELFQTRWTMSYLRGPLTLSQIEILSADQKTQEPNFSPKLLEEQQKIPSALEEKPQLPSSITEYFLRENTDATQCHYKPWVIGFAKMHFINAQYKVDTWQEIAIISRLDEEGKKVLWDEGKIVNKLELLTKNPEKQATYALLSEALMEEKSYTFFAKQLAQSLYQNQTVTIYQTTNPKKISKTDESEDAFRTRIAQDIQQEKEENIAKIKEKYESKLNSLNAKLQRAEEKLADRQQKAWLQKLQTFISFLALFIKAFMSRIITKGTISETANSLKRAAKNQKNSQNTLLAEDSVATYQEQIENLQSEMKDEISFYTLKNEENIDITTAKISPRKSDIFIEKIALLWKSN